MVDVDGVLAEFTLAFTREAVKLGLAKTAWPTPEQLTWDHDFNVDKVWAVVDSTPWWWARLGRACSIDELALLNKLTYNHRVVFCTNRKAGIPHVQRQTFEWLNKYGITYPNVVVSDDKGGVAKALKIDFSIDDRVKNVNEIAAVGCESYVLDYPYNRNGCVGKRVGSVTEFLEVVNGR